MKYNRPVTKQERANAEITRAEFENQEWTNIDYIAAIIKQYLLSNANCERYDNKEYAQKQVGYIYETPEGYRVGYPSLIPGNPPNAGMQSDWKLVMEVKI